MIPAKTYEIKTGPKVFDTDRYIKIKNEEYKELLNTAKTENEIHRFFESNPSFVPGAWTPGTKSGHYPLHCALITQPVLQGLSTKIPDFMWISTHSAGWYPTLIEIENPNKKIFKSNGVPTADFTQAKNQLEQWRTWFNNPSNIQQFLEMYRIPGYMRNQRQMKLHTILVYGRRGEFDSNPTWSKDRLSFTSPDLELMSYDRLSSDRGLTNAITIKLNKDNRYEVVSVPPTLKLGPNDSDRLIHIVGIDKAIERNLDISNERKAFLKERLKYWTAWIKKGEKGTVNSNDFE